MHELHRVVHDGVNLQAQGLWEAVDPGTDDFRADRTALATILRAVLQDMLTSLAQKETACEAWEAIRTIRVGVERVKEANAQKLRQDFLRSLSSPVNVLRSSPCVSPASQTSFACSVTRSSTKMW